jgi:fermentation-respiration switch protein FrsA (DUF1100 family)
MIALLEHLLTFKPNKQEHGALQLIKHQRLRIGSEFGFDLDAAWFSRRSASAVLFLHGNRHNITRFYEHYALFERLGVACLTFDYPGYGLSKGAPTEAALYASARAAYSHLVHHLKFNPERIAIYGCSLGGAVAIELASTVNAGCLITESTFTNSHEIASFLYPYLPIARFLKRRFSNDRRLRDIQIPKLIIHGDQDLRVPVSMGQRLFTQASEPKSIIIVPEADHIDCVKIGGEPLWSRIGEFISINCADR